MWPFSDRNVSRATRAVIKYLKRQNVPKEERKKATLDFLRGFEHGVNTFKNNRIGVNTRIPWRMIPKILKEGIPQNPYFGRTLFVAPIDDPNNPAVFGACVGYIVGILKFQSRQILSYDVYSSDCAEFIKALRDKPGIYEGIRDVVVEWLNEMEPQRGSFTNKEKENYNVLRSAV